MEMNHGSIPQVFVLTPREREVLDYLATGQTNPQIASQLHISPETVKSHVGNILSKLGVASRRDVRRMVLDHAFPAHDGFGQ
jgi:DNA-binding NarL/FixJ family response regulator